MDNIKIEQYYRKLTNTTMILMLGGIVSLVPLISNVYAVPPDSRWGGQMGVNCTGESKGDRWFVTCCWREPIPGQILGQEYCQRCENTGSSDNPNWACDPKQPKAFQSTSERDDAVPPRGGEILDESQPTNPTFNSNKETIFEENLAQDQPMQFSSNDEENQEREELTETNNPNIESNTQDNDDSSTSETTTSLSKKGNTQNSPVPPECPKQGPIPPDCTMKPKF